MGGLPHSRENILFYGFQGYLSEMLMDFVYSGAFKRCLNSPISRRMHQCPLE